MTAVDSFKEDARFGAGLVVIRDLLELKGETNLDESGLAVGIRDLMMKQRVGVLCTSSENQPYGSPMGFVFDNELRWISFATSRWTRKTEILSKNPLACFVVDNRTIGNIDPNVARAIIAAGKVIETSDDMEGNSIRTSLCQKYPEAVEFFRSPDTIILKLLVSQYTFVAGFEKGIELRP